MPTGSNLVSNLNPSRVDMTFEGFGIDATRERAHTARSQPSKLSTSHALQLRTQVFVGGGITFLTIYNYLVTGRILLSWFPQAQGVAALQPLFVVTDPFLNALRGLGLVVFGLDLR